MVPVAHWVAAAFHSRRSKPDGRFYGRKSVIQQGRADVRPGEFETKGFCDNRVVGSNPFSGHAENPAPVLVVGPLRLSADESDTISLPCKSEQPIDVAFHPEGCNRDTPEAQTGGKKLHPSTLSREQVRDSGEGLAPLRVMTDFFRTTSPRSSRR